MASVSNSMLLLSSALLCCAQAFHSHDPHTEELRENGKAFLVDMGKPKVEIIEHKVATGQAPGILFNGYTSGHIEGSLDRKTKSKYPWCPVKAPKLVLWPYPKPAGNNFYCWLENMEVTQHGEEYENAPGTNLTTPGEASGSYDWRFGGKRPKTDKLYESVAANIEAQVEKSKQKVVITGRSMGTVESYAFLMSKSLAWREKYVCAWLPIWPVFGGSPFGLLQAASAFYGTLGLPSLNASREFSAGVPSLIWLFPRPGKAADFWNNTEILIANPKKHYTAYQLTEMLRDMGLTTAEKMLPVEAKEVLHSFEPPYVNNTYVFYGSGVKTASGCNYTKDFIKNASIVPEGCRAFENVPDNGDGIVPLRSTARAEVWKARYEAKKLKFGNLDYPGMKHAGSNYQSDYNKIVAGLHCDVPVPPKKEQK